MDAHPQAVYPYALNDRVGDEYMEKKKKLLAISSCHYIVYTNVQVIIKIKLHNSFLKQNFVKILNVFLEICM